MSRSQKIMKVLSILAIIGGTLAVIFGILLFLGFGYAATSPEIYNEVEGFTPEMGRTLVLGSLPIVLSGIFNVILGISGLVAAKDANKVMPVYILSGISLIIGIVSLVNSAMSGQFNVTDIFSLLIPILMVWCAFNVKKQRDAGV